MIFSLLPLAVAQETAGMAVAAVPLDAAVVVQAPAAATGPRELGLGLDLHVQTDPMLQGLAASHTIPFTLPRGWALNADPLVRLAFDHSAALDPKRSSLTVLVNDKAIATVALTADNVAGGELVARVPRQLIEPYNRLQLQVVQHVTDQCEDPFDPSLWTRVSRTSTLTLDAEPLVETPDLLAFPYPIVDARGYGSVEITVVGSRPLLASELSALGRLGVALGRLASYRTLAVRPPVDRVERLRTNGLAVGIYGNDPVVTSLLSEAPPAGSGVLALVAAPHDPSLAILVVSGADEEGLAKAVEALVGQARFPVLSGREVVISTVEPGPPPPPLDEVLPVPRDRDTFTFADLGLEDRTVRGFYAESIRVPLVLEGDARPPQNGLLRLAYAHSALVDARLSAVEVRLNGVVLRSRHLADGDDGQQILAVELPAEVIEPASELEIVFHLFPDEFDPCRRVSDRPLWATVFASSEITLVRDRYAFLPDLGLLRHRWWPLSLDAGDGGLVIALPDRVGPGEASAALLMAAELGRTSTTVAPSVDVVAGATLDGARGRDLVVLADADAPHGIVAELTESGALTLTGDADRRLAANGELLTARVGTPYGTIEGLLLPGERDAIVLRAAAGTDLLSATRALVDPSRVAALVGTACVLPAEGGARVLDVAQKTAVGRLSIRSKVRSWIAGSWGWVGLAVPVSAVLAAGAIASWARRRGGQT